MVVVVRREAAVEGKARRGRSRGQKWVFYGRIVITKNKRKTKTTKRHRKSPDEMSVREWLRL